VGKTSLGQVHCRRPLDRKYIRYGLVACVTKLKMSVANRKTYIGACCKPACRKRPQSGVKIPVPCFDEIDQMGNGSARRPRLCRLEVLRPGNRITLQPMHYLEVDYDLSDVMFVCTSNVDEYPSRAGWTDGIIRIPGYTEDKK